MKRIFTSFLAGLEDYTINERGDIGSWVRLACIAGLCRIILGILENAAKYTTLEPPTPLSSYLPLDIYHATIGGVLKQGVERLDNVRLRAGHQFRSLLEIKPPDIPGGEAWQVRGSRVYAIDHLRL